jgi:hypothetical protein
MSTNPRKRKTAVPHSGKTVKTSVILDVEDHTRVSAAAGLRGMTMNAFIVEALQFATKSIVLFDRSKKADRGKPDDRPESELKISSDGEEEAA